MRCAQPQLLHQSHYWQAQAPGCNALAVQCSRLVRHPALQQRRHPARHIAAQSDSTAGASIKQQTEVHSFALSSWQSEAAGVLSQLGLPNSTTPQQLWQHLTDTSTMQTQAQHPQQPALQLDISSCTLLLLAAAATCSTQQQHNQLHPLFQAAVAVFPSFQLQDFRQLLQLCAQARFVPDKEWLASIYYADTGGFERLYKEESPEALVLLLSDFAAMLASPSALFQDLSAALSQQKQQQHPGAPGTLQPSPKPPAGREEANIVTAAEVSALQAAMQQASTNLAAIQQDPLLAGELSAVGGYWLLRRFMPALQDQPELILKGLGALPGLGYKVLDADDADALISQLTPHLQSWSPHQLATAVISSLPCLGDIPPSDGQQFALLFAGVGAAAADICSQEAARVLMVLAQLPGYAPDAQVAQALLTVALQPPMTHMTARQLYQLLQAAGELGAAPSGPQLQQVQAFLSG